MTSNSTGTPSKRFGPGTRLGRQSALTLISCLLTLLGRTWELHAQPAVLNFEHLTAEQGLSSNQVTAIIQDSRGFMWFATANGLNRYDGYRFTTFKTEPLDSASLSGPWINLLYEDTHADLWITTGGLNRFDRVTGRISRHLSGRWLTSICEDTSAHASQDGMWFTTLGQGVYQYNRTSNRFTEYRHNTNDSNSISSDSTFCAAVDGVGTLWIGTANGLNSLDKSRRQFARHTHGPGGPIYILYEDPDEPSRLLWIGAHDGLYVYDRTSDSFLRYRNDFGNPRLPKDNDVRTLYCDTKGRLWVGMMGGIGRFDRSTRQFTSYQGGLSTDTWGFVNKAWSTCEDRAGTMWMVSPWGPLRRFDEMRNQWTPVQIVSDHEVTFHAVCEDRSGTMWFGTVADAVLKLDAAYKPFSLYTNIPGDSSSLSSATVTGICEDASGTLWVGTPRGLNKLDASTGKFTHYRHDDKNPHSLNNDRIWPILEDSNGRLWIGTHGGGVDEFDRSRQRFVHHRFSPGNSLGLPNDAIDALCESRDGTLWIGTDDVSIAEYDPSSNIFRRHIPDYAKSGGVGAGVIAILEDHTGMIWCAIPPMGLNSYDRSSDRWTQFVRDARAGNVPSSDVAPGTLSLCEDRGGTIWVGTDEGLYKFERETGTFTRFSVKDGLADNVINAILEDERDCLWLCTARGLSRFDPRNGSFRNYDAGDGVTVGQFRPSTGYRNRKGEMFFGGSNGFIRFHPDSIKDNLYVPPIVITAFKKFDKLVSLDSAISETRHVELSYKENVFSFEFAALNYSATEKNQYAYKLEGFDNDWIYCGTRRYATYTNLDGGSYIFRVKGSNNDGIWNEEGTSIAVIITPPFWKTWWFTIMFWLTIAGSTGGTIRYVEIRKLKGKLERLEQQQALARVRLRISEDMHDEVGATLTQISILSELARKEGEGSGESADHIKRISEKSREVVDNIGEIIWAIDPNNDHLENLVAYLRQYTFQYFKSSPIQCRLEAPDDLAPLSMSAQARRNIFLVCKESMHNVIKHSQAAEFILTLRQSPRGLEILMKDDGKGFLPEEHSGFGNGLRNMKRRMEEVGGIFKIESGPEQGTLTVLTVPLREDPLSGRDA